MCLYVYECTLLERWVYVLCYVSCMSFFLPICDYSLSLQVVMAFFIDGSMPNECFEGIFIFKEDTCFSFGYLAINNIAFSKGIPQPPHFLNYHVLLKVPFFFQIGNI